MTGHYLGYGTTTVPGLVAASVRTARSRITTTRRLLTGSWTSDVEVLEAAVARFNDEKGATSVCRVAFFELGSDDQLHVNVTHKYPTLTAPGWIGPGKVADGFVHNRRFSNRAPSRIAREIHDMVFAARC